MKKNILIIVFLFSFFNFFAQRQANIWYFGNYAGLDFNSGVPIPLTDGQINRWEGVAAICDSLGNLLFYTDGDTVWNAHHQPMPNGWGLLGAPSSTESAIIIPYPEHDSLYLLFTVDAEGGPDGLNYSIINMSLDNGLGDIQQKNIHLIDSVSEKVTAVGHKNGRDFWVVSHEWCTDSFYVYLVTPSGVQPPQIYEIGTRHADIGLHGNNAVGYMRLSPDGSRLALALQVRRCFEIYDFNNETGEITNAITIPDPGGSPYGVEFSPDASKLYMTSKFYLYQADITYSTADSIVNSIVLIDSSLTQNFFGAVQLATDGKIYMAHEFSNYLGIINNPEKNGDSCNFELDGIFLNGSLSRMGLPDYIQSFFVPPDFRYSAVCFGDSTAFAIKDTSGLDSVFWDFGDTLSGENTSRNFFPKHKFSNSGRYEIKLTMWRNGVDFHKDRIIQINALPDVFLGNDTLICTGDSILLNAFCENCQYLWQDSSVNSTTWADTANIYSVIVTNRYTDCYSSDTIEINLAQLPEFELPDTGFCQNDSVKIGLSYADSVSYMWNTGATDSVICVANQGNYSLTITDSIGCKFTDTVEVTEFQLPEFSLSADTVICPETQIVLTFASDYTHVWNDTLFADTLLINNAGTYKLTLIDTNNCQFSDTVKVTEIFPPVVNLGNDTTLCEGQIFTLYASPQYCDYQWNDQSTENYLDVSEAGLYFLKSQNICGYDIDSIYIDFEYCGDIYIPNIFTPNNDGINDFFSIKGLDNDTWQIFIYNRWGNLVFYSPDYQNDWDGEKCSDGTYYYLLTNTSQTKKFSGTVRIYKQ